MKKPVILFFALIFLLFTGCENIGKNIPEIDSYIWQVKTVQTSENNGEVIACSPEKYYIYKSAKQIDLTCKAEKGKLTITDSTNNKTYEGTYKKTNKAVDGVIYEINIEGKKGYAASGITTYSDGSSENVFNMSIDDYSLSFTEKTK